MNNKKLGTAFEKELCDLLAQKGYWVHFIVPDSRGAQPFDVIAVKDGVALAIDCKTCVLDTFNISRLEENQRFAFEKWIACGNVEPIIAIKHGGRIYTVGYLKLKEQGKVKIGDCICLSV